MVNFNYKESRKQMIKEQIMSRGIQDQRVLKAFQKVPRHLFVPDNEHQLAYRDHPLCIGKGQTISQPYIVALMTEALQLNAQSRVLEIGTGSGYQTAILAEIAKTVYTVERIDELQEKAKYLLQNLNYHNIFFRVGDGSEGWPEDAPFDGILVAAAAPGPPNQLLEQLDDGGRIIIPIGDQHAQELTLITRKGDNYKETNLGGCRFVPLVKE